MAGEDSILTKAAQTPLRPPCRVQRTRRKGGGMPAESVYVGRPSKWGNPYHGDGPFDHAHVAACYRSFVMRPEKAAFRAEVRAELMGKDLACWCALDQPCHADVLLEIANEPSDPIVTMAREGMVLAEAVPLVLAHWGDDRLKRYDLGVDPDGQILMRPNPEGAMKCEVGLTLAEICPPQPARPIPARLKED